MDSSFDRPGRFLAWAKETFGEIAVDRRERARRFLEEAIELAGAAGISPEDALRILERCYERPQGFMPVEAGQAQVTLELFAKSQLIDLEVEADREFFRVQKIPKEEWLRRHAAKVALGIAG